MAIHYVENKGSVALNIANDGEPEWGNSTSISTPCSIGTALANAVAGDTIYFRGGTYDVGADGGGGYVGALNPVNSGTEGNSIIFMAYPGETPVLNGDASGASDKLCRVIGLNDSIHSWITFDGLTIQANGGTYGGSIVIGTSASSPSCTGIIVQNCIVNGGTGAPTDFDDNYDGIRANATTNSIIRRNKVYGFRRSDWGGSNDNFAAIKVYGKDALTIENNELYDSNTGISVKRPSDTLTIRYNYIHDMKIGLQFNINTGTSYGSNTWNIYHNVINANKSGAYGIVGASDNGSYYNDYFTFYNNTIKTSNDAIAYLGLCANLKWYNNIGIGSQASDYGFWTTVRNVSTILEEDYNQWGTNSFKIQVKRYESGEATYTSLATWQASGQLIGGGNPGVGDLISDPLFTNGSGNYSLLSDFNLQVASPCKGTGKGGVDMGADISLVGVEGEEGSPSQSLYLPPHGDVWIE